MDATLLQIDVDLIDPNPEQPRTHFDEIKLRELGQSIVEHGLEQAITVEITNSGRYILRDGERRLRAHKLMGLETIMAIVKLPPHEATERERLIGAFVANYHREALNPIEEAMALAKMSDVLDMTYEEIGRHVGMSKSTVANKIRLINTLPGDVQTAVAGGLLSERQAMALLTLFSLPDDWQARNKAYIDHLVDWSIRQDVPSGTIRREVETAIRAYSDKVADRVWFGMPFDDFAGGIVQETCHGCPFMESEVCVQSECFSRKTSLYRQAQTAVVHEMYPDYPVVPHDAKEWELGKYWRFGDGDWPLHCEGMAAYILERSGRLNVMLAEGIGLVCQNGNNCDCQKKVLREKPENGAKPEAQEFGVVLNRNLPKPYGLTLGDRHYWLADRDVKEIVMLFCMNNGIDLDVLRAKPDDDPPTPPDEPVKKSLTDEVIEFCKTWQDKGRTWKDITNPSHTNGIFWDAIKKDFDKHMILYKSDSDLKFAIKQAFSVLHAKQSEA